MADPQHILAERVRRALIAAFGQEYAGIDPVIRPSQFADFQANVALPLGKRLGRSPRDVAADLLEHLDVADVCSGAEVSGPGFVNMTLRDDWIASTARALLCDERLGIEAPARHRIVVVDYSAPNVAKEMHVGHLRTTIVGDAIARVLEHLGDKVIRANHIGDWGTPFGMLIEHLLDVGQQAAQEQLSSGELTAFYQDARRKFDADPEFADRSRRRVVALQSGDAETLRLWHILVEDSNRYFNMIYRRLGVTLTDDDVAAESFYNSMLADVCDELIAAGVAVVSDGALCVFPPGFTGRDGTPLPLILRKSDGGYGYDTTDLAAIRHRIRDLGADRLIYVVGATQALHFSMLFAAARQASWLTDDILAEHAPIGTVLGSDGKLMRTRSGDQVKLVTLLDEAVQRAEQVIADRYSDPEVCRQIAEAAGIGGIKYADLSVARDSDYIFDFDRMLALTGNTGPYLQYATARIRSIFRKAQEAPEISGNSPESVVSLTAAEHAGSDAAFGQIDVAQPAERDLALRLLEFGSVVSQVSESLEPHRLCAYLYDVASAFTTFYEQCPVLKAPDAAIRDSRQALCAITLRVLLRGLDLLGVPAPDRM